MNENVVQKGVDVVVLAPFSGPPRNPAQRIQDNADPHLPLNLML
jgi:hypothetical protein